MFINVEYQPRPVHVLAACSLDLQFSQTDAMLNKKFLVGITDRQSCTMGVCTIHPANPITLLNNKHSAYTFESVPRLTTK